MKVTIKKEINLNGSCYFLVYADGNLVSAHMFYVSAKDDDVYSESKNLANAMEMAKRIENGETQMIETIYETPTKTEEA